MVPLPWISGLLLLLLGTLHPARVNAAPLSPEKEDLTCRYPTLCSEAAVRTEELGPTGGTLTLWDQCEAPNIVCATGLECVHAPIYWQQHPERWPPEVTGVGGVPVEVEPLCGHTYAELVIRTWPMPGAPQVCQVLAKAVVIADVNRLLVAPSTFPEPTRYLITEGRRVASDCCAQVGGSDALRHELERLLLRFNEGTAPANEGGLPLCAVNETIAEGVPSPYVGNEAEWYHRIYYGDNSYEEGLSGFGIGLVASIQVGILIVFCYVGWPRAWIPTGW